ncbi:MAG TPA: WYL domain-containing protein [Planctomycetaceae bacterium]|nr:WYL domain-containing protein [Planctomycetaceae bacterium]
MKKKKKNTAEPRINRVIRVVQLLQTGHQNVESLAKACSVHPRTIQRDIAFLRERGMAVIYDDQANRFRFLSDLLLPETHFTPDEVLALITLCLRPGAKNVIPFMEPVQTAALKLVSVLPLPLKEHLERYSGALRILSEPVNSLTESQKSFQDLLTAYHDRTSVRIVYQGPLDSEPFTTLLSPYQLFFGKRSWYAVGRSSLHVETRTFHVGRILKTERTDNRFQIPSGFTLRKYLRNAWSLIPEKGPDSNVVVRFSRLVSRNVAEVNWHEKQDIRELDDGGIEFRVTVSGLKEISWWILGYGKEAEVLAPEALRDILRAHVAAMARLYGVLPPQPGTQLGTPPGSQPGISLQAPGPPVRSKRPRVDLPDWNAGKSDESE